MIFNLHPVLSNVMKPHAVPLCPAQNVNHSFVQYLHAVYAGPSLP